MFAAGANRCTIRDQNRVGFVGRLGELLSRNHIAIQVLGIRRAIQMGMGMLQCDIRSGTAAGVDITDHLDQLLHVVGRQSHRANALVNIYRFVKSDQCHGTIVIGVRKLTDGVRQGILEVVQTVQLTVGPVERVGHRSSIFHVCNIRICCFNIVIDSTLADLIAQAAAITLERNVRSIGRRCSKIPIVINVVYSSRIRLFAESSYNRVHRILINLPIAGSVLIIRLGIVGRILVHPVLTIMPDGKHRGGDTLFRNDVVQLIRINDISAEQVIQLRNVSIVTSFVLCILRFCQVFRIKIYIDGCITVSIFHLSQARREEHGVGLIDNEEDVHRVHLIQSEVGFRRHHDLVGSVVVVLHLGDLVSLQQVVFVVHISANGLITVKHLISNGKCSLRIHIPDVALCGGGLLNGISAIGEVRQ